MGLAQAILFDIDGTLVDSNDLHTEAWVETFRHFGVDLPYDRVRGQIGKGGDNLMPALLPPELVSERQEEIETFRSDLFKRAYMARVTAFPGVRALFERLRADGKKIVLASSAKGEELDHHVELLGIGELIDASTSKDDVERSKPCPDIFAAALESVAPVPARQAVVVGDTPYDIEAAIKLGIPTIGVLSGGFEAEQLREAGAVFICDGIEDLNRRYEESPLAG